MVTALITRPRQDALDLADQLSQRGLAVLVEPLLDIQPVDGGDINTDGVQGILATSANGVRALAAALADRALPVWCVGDATARTARDLGYDRVESAGGDVDSLAALVTGRCRADDGAFIHAAGSVTAGDLSAKLTQAGFEVRRLVLYRADPAQALSDDLTRALRQGDTANPLAVALFFSPRTAATFAGLVTQAGLADGLRAVDAYCLSPAVAQALGDLPFAHRHVADAPTQASLLACLDARRATPSPGAAPGADPMDKGLSFGGVMGLALLLLAVVGGGTGAFVTYDQWAPLLLPQSPAPLAAPTVVAGGGKAVDEDAVVALKAQIADLQTRLTQAETLAQRPDTLSAQVEALARQVADVQRTSVEAATVLRLADRVEKAETQLHELYGRRSQSVALLLAVGQLREAQSRAMPYDTALRAVQALASKDADVARALDVLRPRAVAGVPSATTLIARFSALSAAVIRAQALPQDVPWWRSTLDRLAALVLIRREDGLAQGDDPAAILARTGWALNTGDLAAAAKEMTALTGPAAQAAALWLADLDQRVATDRALGELTAHVTALVGAAP